MNKRTYLTRTPNAETAMYAVRIAMYDHNIDDLMDATGKSRACLYSIRSGRTKWPRHQTFFALIDYLELDMLLVKRGMRNALN